MRLNFFNLTNLTLLTALSLSTIAAYYSIMGLIAIFAGAVVPIIVMGTVLEVGKIVTTVWLRKYWHRASWAIKSYLIPAVILLAFLTSMGIFGFLSKAHTDQGIVSGDSQAKLNLYDEKIKTQRDNIELARKALQQMDAQVDARLSRSDTEQGAERAVQIRRQQQGERTKLQKEISDAQKEITRLNEERAPIAAETRKIEAEVGPIKYIAAFIYGDNPDANLLEKAVRWVIILIVIVFDPLAIALVLAANSSKDWDKENLDEPDYEPDDGPLTDEQITQVQDNLKDNEIWPFPEPIITKSIFPNEAMKFVDPGEHPLDKLEGAVEEKPVLEEHPYLQKEFVHFKDTKPIVAISEEIQTKRSKVKKTVVNDISNTMEVKQDLPYRELSGGYVSFQGKHMSKEALFAGHPEFLKLTEDSKKPVKSGFGIKFPEQASKGDVFTRVDVLPNKVFKFDGTNWIEINKEISNTYLYNTKYLEFLVDKIANGEYGPDLLSDNERSTLEDHIKLTKLNNKSS